MGCAMSCCSKGKDKDEEKQPYAPKRIYYDNDGNLRHGFVCFPVFCYTRLRLFFLQIGKDYRETELRN